MPRMHGERVRSPCDPLQIRLISVTCGDLLEAVHSIAGRKGGGKGSERAGARRGSLAAPVPGRNPARRTRYRSALRLIGCLTLKIRRFCLAPVLAGRGRGEIHVRGHGWRFYSDEAKTRALRFA